MTMEQPELNAIRHAAFGVAGYAELTAEQLAGILGLPASMRPGELQTVLGEALAAGATAADFATVWQYPEWLTRLESALGNGDMPASPSCSIQPRSIGAWRQMPP